MMHRRFRITTLLSVALILAGGFALHAWVAASGDVDRDGRLTTRDAVLITELLQAPARLALRPLREACDVTLDGQCDWLDATTVVMATLVSASDYDGDGVPNPADCAPFDDRLSTAHTYYFDWDDDSFGAATGRPLCTVDPPTDSVAWSDDPDDQNPSVVTPTIPKGARRLGLDFAEGTADAAWRFDLAQELGADVATLQIPWSRIEVSAGGYDPAYGNGLTQINGAYPALRFGLSLTLSPIQGTHLTLPDDLRLAVLNGTIRLSDPQVIARYKNLLSYVRARLPDVPLVSLQIGQDVDLYFTQVTQPLFWPDFGAFVAAVSAHARQLWGPDLPIGLTATHQGLLTEPTRSLMLALNQVTTAASVSYQPRHADFTVIAPEEVELQVQQLIALYYPKPIYFNGVGYPSGSVTGSSPTRQAQFLHAFFRVWDRYAALIPFASFQRLNDFSRARAESEAAQLAWQLPPSVLPTASAYLESLGLRTFAGAGTHKTAYRTLRTLAFERGWWHEPARQARAYRMGFTHTPHDLSPDPGERDRGFQLDVVSHPDGRRHRQPASRRRCAVGRGARRRFQLGRVALQCEPSRYVGTVAESHPGRTSAHRLHQSPRHPA